MRRTYGNIIFNFFDMHADMHAQAHLSPPVSDYMYGYIYIYLHAHQHKVIALRLKKIIFLETQY